ncbi:unnamed protein product [Brassica rapa subsp. trilocularis]
MERSSEGVNNCGVWIEILLMSFRSEDTAVLNKECDILTGRMSKSRAIFCIKRRLTLPASLLLYYVYFSEMIKNDRRLIGLNSTRHIDFDR